MKTDPERTAELATFAVGDRVAISPSSWLYLAGAHFGTVAKIGRTKLHVTATINGVTYAIPPRMATKQS